MRKSLAASRDADESLSPTMLGISARRARVSGEMETPVRGGWLYRMMGRRVLSATALKWR
ncbi:hypothetical protein D3C87_1964280 [compost metagenome]